MLFGNRLSKLEAVGIAWACLSAHLSGWTQTPMPFYFFTSSSFHCCVEHQILVFEWKCANCNILETVIPITKTQLWKLHISIELFETILESYDTWMVNFVYPNSPLTWRLLTDLHTHTLTEERWWNHLSCLGLYVSLTHKPTGQIISSSSFFGKFAWNAQKTLVVVVYVPLLMVFAVESSTNRCELRGRCSTHMSA